MMTNQCTSGFIHVPGEFFYQPIHQAFIIAYFRQKYRCSNGYYNFPIYVRVPGDLAYGPITLVFLGFNFNQQCHIGISLCKVWYNVLMPEGYPNGFPGFNANHHNHLVISL